MNISEVIEKIEESGTKIIPQIKYLLRRSIIQKRIAVPEYQEVFMYAAYNESKDVAGFILEYNFTDKINSCDFYGCYFFELENSAKAFRYYENIKEGLSHD